MRELPQGTNTETAALAEEPKLPAKRTPAGQFVKGISGNPAGRAKGTKNKITLERLLLEEKLREALTIEGPKLLRRAIRMAFAGNDRVMRVILDKMLTTPRADDDSQTGDRDIQVIVNNYTKPDKALKAIEGEVVRQSINPPPKKE